MKRATVLVYGILSYLIFFASFLYAVGFLGNFVVPKQINEGSSAGLTTALAINALLLGLFAVQHSLMARDFFKEWMTTIIPEEAERSTYVLLSSLVLFLLFWQWVPMSGTIWDVSGTIGEPVLLAVFGLGWLVVLVSTFMIDHFDLFGLKQVFYYYRDWNYTHPDFQVPFLYRYVRHPLMLGFIIAFWATPHMTVGHLVFAIATTGYIIVGILFEEQTLIRHHGETYEAYREQVPMLTPIPGMSFDPEEQTVDRED